MSLALLLVMCPSYIHDVYRDSGNETAVTAVEKFAVDLANRFSSIVGCTRSWDTANPDDFEVRILDVDANRHH